MCVKRYTQKYSYTVTSETSQDALTKNKILHFTVKQWCLSNGCTTFTLQRKPNSLNHLLHMIQNNMVSK